MKRSKSNRSTDERRPKKSPLFLFPVRTLRWPWPAAAALPRAKSGLRPSSRRTTPPKNGAEFLKKEYGIGGQSWTFLAGSHGFLEYNARGIQLRSYPEGQEQRFSWSDAAKRIGVLIAAASIWTKQNKTPPEVPSETTDEPRTEGETLREKLAERGIVNGQVVEPEKLDNDPFIRQMVEDAEQAAAEPAADAPEKPLTVENVTDIQVESSSYSAISREKEYHLSCKINGGAGHAGLHRLPAR